MADLARSWSYDTTPSPTARRLVAVGTITRRDGRTITVRATPVGVTGTVTPAVKR